MKHQNANSENTVETPDSDLRVAIYKRKPTGRIFKLSSIMMQRKAAQEFIEQIMAQESAQGEGPHVWKTVEYRRTDTILEKLAV